MEKDKFNFNIRFLQYNLPDKPQNDESKKKYIGGLFGVTYSMQISENNFVSGIELLVSNEVIATEWFGDNNQKHFLNLTHDDISSLTTPLTVYFRNHKHPRSLKSFQSKVMHVLKENNVLG